MITATALRKIYPGDKNGTDVMALNGIDLSVPAGVIHGIVGQSGAGKSTLIRCLTALERPTSGSVTVAGKELTALAEADLRAARRRIGVVFQHVHLLEQRTALANVAHPLAIVGTPRAEREKRAKELLELVGLAGRERAYPAQLSGGQRQRVGIARALASEPPVLLLDEPTSALDGKTTRQVLDLVRELRTRLGITVVIITHEMSVVREVCDTVSLIENGEIVQEGTVADVVQDGASPLGRALVPVPQVTLDGDPHLLEISFTSRGNDVGQILQLVGGLDGAEVVSATVETLAGEQVARVQLALGDGENGAGADAVRNQLTSAGLQVTS